MVGAAQQIQQGLVVVLAGARQRRCGAARVRCSNSAGDEALGQHGVARQFVDHAGVLQQVARRPAWRRPAGAAAARARPGAPPAAPDSSRGAAAARSSRPARTARFFARRVPSLPATARCAAPAAAGARATLRAGPARAGARCHWPDALAKALRGSLLQQVLQVGRGAAWRRRCSRVQASSPAPPSSVSNSCATSSRCVSSSLQERAAVWHSPGCGRSRPGRRRGSAARGSAGRPGTGCGAPPGAGIRRRAASASAVACGIRPACASALQRIQRGARAQLGKLAAAHHLQQLHGEFDFADAAARQLDVVGALRVGRRCVWRRARESAGAGCAANRTRCSPGSAGTRRAAPRRAVPAPSRLQCSGPGRHHAALEPGKALPLAALHLEVILQRAERDGRRARSCRWAAAPGRRGTRSRARWCRRSGRRWS